MVSNSYSFTAQIINPPTQQPFNMWIYVLYAPNLFIEQYYINTLTLAPLTINLSNSIIDNRVFSTTQYNSSLIFPYAVSGGANFFLTLAYGAFACAKINLTSNIVLNLISCSTNSLVFNTTSTLNAGLWLTYNVVNHYSVRSDNYLQINVTGPSPNFYNILVSKCNVILSLLTESFVITNLVTEYNVATNITVV